MHLFPPLVRSSPPSLESVHVTHPGRCFTGQIPSPSPGYPTADSHRPSLPVRLRLCWRPWKSSPLVSLFYADPIWGNCGHSRMPVGQHDSTGVGAPLDAPGPQPVSLDHRSAFPRNPKVISLVSCVFRSGGPSNVPRLVVTVVVDTIDRVRRTVRIMLRPRTDVSHESNEPQIGLSPLVTHSDAATSVVSKALMSWVVTSVDRLLQHLILRTMNCRLKPEQLFSTRKSLCERCQPLSPPDSLGHPVRYTGSPLIHARGG